ncbi:MAG: hypothetical protein ACD_42C00612G0002 [uncultured bacterium]|nr:MAG: hypothetical protein ACD_42C00612G0002 [uncultured bacterium]
MLSRIRDIRSSEKVFWKKVLDIYATSIDYTPNTEMSQQFFKTIQNKMHWAAHGKTAAEIIVQDRPKMKIFCSPGISVITCTLIPRTVGESKYFFR